jgi:hypothetical protein
MEAICRFKSIGCEVSLAEIYSKVAFGPEAARGGYEESLLRAMEGGRPPSFDGLEQTPPRHSLL